MNKIFIGIAVLSLIYGLITGRFIDMANVILSIPEDGLKIAVALVFSAVFWNGIMYILDEVGVIKFIAKLLHPLLHFLMPELDDEQTFKYISTNIAANMFGLGFAATPSGLNAMKRMKSLSKEKEGVATDSMVTFLVLNTAGVTIIPTSLLAIRQMYGSSNPADFVLLGIFSTFMACVAGLWLDRVLKKRRIKK